MTENAQKDRRLNIRLTSDALARIKAAAALSQQDVSSFLLGAAMDREPRVIPAIVELFKKYRMDRTKD